MKQKLRKPMAWLLTLAMLFTMLPATVLAAEVDGPCQHHAEHTENCHYVAAVEGRDCTHVHDELCGYAEAVEEVLCVCAETDENSTLIHAEGCGYVAAVPAATCTHSHDDACGYVEAVEGHECCFVCTECLAEDEAHIAPEESTEEPPAEDGPVCTCESDDPDWHAPFCALFEASEEVECFCTELCTEDMPNEWCEVCYFDASACAATGEEEGVVYLSQIDGVYQIGSADDLVAFAALVNGGETAIDGKLTTNITINTNVLNGDGTLKGTPTRTWIPIGNDSNKYTGTFDGQNYTVSGLYFNDTTYYVGLFGCVGSGGTVQDVGVIDSYLTGSYYVGGVVGRNYGTVENCRSSATITGSWNTSGVVGYNNGGTVIDCYNTGIVNGTLNGSLGSTSEGIGGIVGYNYGGLITNCYNTGTINGGTDYVGGVVGRNYGGTVTSCYNTGAVAIVISNIGGVVGGVVGSNGGTVTNCYNTASVSGQRGTGGIMGSNDNGCTVTNCYNIGTVTGTQCVGGVAGGNYGTIENCCYLTGCAKDGSQTVQYGIGHYLEGSTTADAEGSTTGKTAAQLASGEAAYLLNGDQTNIAFKQTIGTDTAPNFTGATVYPVTGCDGETIVGYSNTEGQNDSSKHSYGNLFPAQDAVHTPTELKAAVAAHYICEVCGTYFTESKVETTLQALIGATPVHTPGTPAEENRTESTCTVAGSYDEVVYCSVCKTHKISSTPKTLPLADHTPGTAVRENEVPATCYTEGSYNEVVYCSVDDCKEKLSSTPKTLPLAEHTFADTLSYDANTHWYDSTCGHAVTSGLEPHHGGTATCETKAVCMDCGQSYGEENPDHHTYELKWVQTSATHKQIYICCGKVMVTEESHDWGEDNICTTCHYGCSHTYGSAEIAWQADYSSAKATVICSNCEDTKELNCKIDSRWDAETDTLTFTAIAKEGAYTDTQTVKLAVDGGKLTITNSAAEADETVDMIIMVAGYTDDKMTGCQVIENVTGVTKIDLTVSGERKVFFLKPGTYAPLFACAEL